MKIAVIEVEHFVVGLATAELFEGKHELIFFTTKKIEDEMREYNADLCVGDFYHIESVKDNEDQIISICKQENIDLFLINPIFDSFQSLLRIIQEVPGTKSITIHNLNYWFNPIARSLKGWRERKIKKEIINNCDYLIVEDFLYAYIQQYRKKIFKRHKVLNIPSTLYHDKNKLKNNIETKYLTIVIPGSIQKERRNYEDIIQLIQYFAKQKSQLVFSFAGPAIDEYGLWVIDELKKANEISPGIARFYDPNKPLTPNLFKTEMELADLVFTNTRKTFKSFGRTEYYGKTKSTGTLHDIMSYSLPGLFPKHLKVPEKFKGSIFNYNNKKELKALIEKVLEQPDVLDKWKVQAEINSLKFTASEVRKTLPFFK